MGPYWVGPWVLDDSIDLLEEFQTFAQTLGQKWS